MILLLSVRLIDNRFHGLEANGERPNWPPSCFRLFQAIVAGNARGESIPQKVIDALKWLEALPPPVVVVPASKAGRVMLTYVLNNSEKRSRTEKFLRPTLLNGDRLIEFAWQYDPRESTSQNHAQILLDAVRHIRAFGWGVDLAIGHGIVQPGLPEPSESRFQFFPQEHPDFPGIEIRVPTVGSMDSLTECFQQYLGRFQASDSTLLESGGPLYKPWPYTAGIARPCYAFKLLDKNDEPRPHPHAKLVHIAGMVRHVAIERMKQDSPPWIKTRNEWIESFVAGHQRGSADHLQLSYVPLPSVGHTHADALIRNVMIVAPVGHVRELEFLTRRLDGELLTPEACGDGQATTPERSATLSRFTPPPGKFIATRYLGTSKTWHSVTPVILPGHDDKKQRKTERLIQKALAQSGIETPCSFTWQSMPFLRNCLSAHKYDRRGRHTGYHRPAHLRELTAVHLHVTFDHPVSGPLTIGAGRHCGFGLMATADSG